MADSGATPGDNAPIVAALAELGVLRFSGSDVVNFLQGYLTIETTKVDSEPRPAALTNLKGRVVANGWVLSTEPDTIDWVMHGSLIEAVGNFMSRYLAFSKTTAAPRQDDCLILGLAGAGDTPTVAVVSNEVALSAQLAERQPASEARWVEACVRAGIALVTDSTAETFLPQMLGLVEQGAVDFDKGCYLGQEVVARAQHRGEVKRQLVRLSGATAELKAGMDVTDSSGRRLGTLVMIAGEQALAVLGPGDATCLADGRELTRT
ncbi:MAG: hypothetical protein AAGE43_11760 [Pseudomonadota bacterium]